MHEKNTKTPQKFDWDELFTNWYKLLLCGPTSIGLILGIVIPLYVLKGEPTNRFEKGAIGAAIGASVGLVTGGLTSAIGLGICFFKNRHSASQTESVDNQQEQNPITTTIALNPR